MAPSSTGVWVRTRPFFVIMGLHCVAVLLFTRGFLLTRNELPNLSHCSDILESPCVSRDHSSANGTTPDQRCWTRPTVDRLVIIILDALRFDFVAPSTFFEETKPWMNRLKVLQNLAYDQRSSARIFKAIADPPTTSLQRLKGLTTGGLPTFIDVGNSFGATEIVEDNLIHQLVQNGKRVVMMGDDTWVQLFPHHFQKSYAFPSFNVKDLHSVDNGCINHLLPSLYREDWDVLIAHFLGVDHAGHIYGVDSEAMIEKLEQYNGILEKVIEVLQSQSGPGALHENTFLLVMGDHGQTLNGDHGGGSAEEVETSIFAKSFNKLPASIPLEVDNSSCQLDKDRRKICIGSIQQLDFAVTMAALLGIPFPFGSIGHVNPELYALGSGSWNVESTDVGSHKSLSNLEKWMQNYLDVLCINSWQVKRYVDAYSASSFIGFSSEDLLQVADMYAQAEDTRTLKNLSLSKNESSSSIPALKRQMDAYLNFLTSVSELARSKWTEFNLKMMGVGFGVMLISLFIHFRAIRRVNKLSVVYFPSHAASGTSFGLIVSSFMVAIRACSFFSNSYILEEGKVANFLLATTGIFTLRYSIIKRKMLLEAVVFLLVISLLRIGIELGLSKQSITSLFLSKYPSWVLATAKGHPVSAFIAEIVPIIALFLLAYLLYRSVARRKMCWGILKYVTLVKMLCYMLIAVHWASESYLLSLSVVVRNYIPQSIYAMGLGLLLLLVRDHIYKDIEKDLDYGECMVMKTVAILSSWSSTILILSGKQGPLVALATTIGGWCVLRLKDLEQDAEDATANGYPLSVTQWSLFAVCLFFCTGHWCAFDGLRYGAAFIGFDEFILIRQAILLAIDTFGFSHIIPIFGLPLLVSHQYSFGQASQRKKGFLFMQLSRAYLMYGLMMAVTVTFTMICVTIQRRHLMMWGLFAPKFVFDVVGLILTDVLICLASLYYFRQNSKIED